MRSLPKKQEIDGIGLIAAGVALAMVGAAYAAVPAYYAFCRATGFAGTTQVAARDSAVRGERSLTVRFDANVAPGLDWTFEPETTAMTLRTGQTATVFFRVRNRSSHETAAIAAYNVAPEISGALVRQDFLFLLYRAAAGPRRKRGTAGRLLPRSASRARARDGRDRGNHAFLHAFRDARAGQTARAGAGAGASAPKL